MKTKVFADRALRILAFLAVLRFFWIILVVGIMANDAGTPGGSRAGSLIITGGAALGLWVLLCSVWQRQALNLLPARPALRFLVVKLPTYAFGIAGLSWLVLDAIGRYHLAMQPRPEVQRGSAEYPIENPHPGHVFNITGTLPETVPLEAFDAIYETELDVAPNSGDRCQRPSDSFSQYPRPLVARVVVPVIRSDDRYTASVAVDHFIPGECQWHLAEVQYRLFVKGFEYAEPNWTTAKIAVATDADIARAAKLGGLYTGPVHVWCRKNYPGSNVKPFYPEGCGIFENYFPRGLARPHSPLRPELQDAHTLIFVLPETQTVEFDFHDVASVAIER